MSKSETVWFDEVDRGLVNLLKDCIKAPVDGVMSPVYVDIKKSDEDFKVDVYPSVSVYCSNYSADKNRENTVKELITEVDTENNTGKLEKAPKPYKFAYKITLWSKLQSQMNIMTRLLNAKVGRFYNLDVFDASGNATTVFMELKDPISKGDMLTENSRVLQHVYTYVIWTHIDEREQTDVKLTGREPVQFNINE